MHDDYSGDEAGDDADGEPTLYDVLYCNPSATEAELKQAYKQQALQERRMPTARTKAAFRWLMANNTYYKTYTLLQKIAIAPAGK